MDWMSSVLDSSGDELDIAGLKAALHKIRQQESLRRDLRTAKEQEELHRHLRKEVLDDIRPLEQQVDELRMVVSVLSWILVKQKVCTVQDLKLVAEEL